VTQQVSIGPYTLESGITLPDVVVAYVAHGTLAADGGNGVLVTHGYTSGPSMLSPGHHVAESSWAPLLGGGRPLDTRRHFVICSNMLGSSFGSTGPNSIDPATGRPWGPTFPAITLTDIVGVQKRLLDALGVRHLKAVVGPSYGGSQALQWALQYPDMVDAIGVLMSGFTFPPNLSAADTLARLAQSPEWQGGNYHAHGGMVATLFATRMQTMLNYGLDRLFADSLPDAAARTAAMEATCRGWAETFDPYSLVVLAQAAESFDVRGRLGDIRARLLFVVGSTDKVFPPAEATRQLLTQVRTQTRYLELDSPYGHMASGVEWKRLEPELRGLLDDTSAAA
jgi:homoserine O-acetyltransferase